MLTLKLVVAAGMFIASGGLLFSEHFKANRLVRGIAALFALLAFVLLSREIMGVGTKETASLHHETIVTQSLQEKPEENQKRQPKIAANAPAELPTQIAFGSDAITLMSKGGRIFVWPLGNEIREIHNEKDVSGSHLSMDGKYLAHVNIDDGSAQVQDLDGGAVSRVSFPKKKEIEIDFSKGEAVVTSNGFESLGEILLSNNGEYLALSYDWTPVAQEHGEAEITNSRKSRLVIAPVAQKAKPCSGDSWHDDRVSSMQVSGQSRAIVSGGWDGNIYIKGMDCSHVALIFASNNSIKSVALSSDATVVAASDFSALRTWKIVDGKAVPWAGSYVAAVTCERLAFDHKDILVACGTETGSLLIIDAGESKVLHRLNVENSVTEMAFSTASALLAVVDVAGEISIFDAQAGELLARARIFNAHDWVILARSGGYCGSEDAEKYLRVDRVVSGMIWDSHELSLMTEQDRQHLREPCSNWQLRAKK